MIRSILVLLILASGGAIVASEPPMKWPLRAAVTDLHGRPVAFQAVTLGGDLIIEAGQRSFLGRSSVSLDPLRHGDTLRAATPAAYPLDLTHGPVVFFTRGRDSVRVVVGRRLSFGDISPVTATGRRLTVRLSNSQVVIDAK